MPKLRDVILLPVEGSPCRNATTTTRSLTTCISQHRTTLFVAENADRNRKESIVVVLFSFWSGLAWGTTSHAALRCSESVLF
jgi:hypothetical protein